MADPFLGLLPSDRDRESQLHTWLAERRIRFKSLELLNLCFIHPSWANENGRESGDNQRLEFLGDSVLGLTVAHWLYERFPDRGEGELAKFKSQLVSADSLASVAREHRLGEVLLLGKGEENNGGRDKTNILADGLEAFWGAHYLDQGWEATRTLILEWLRLEDFRPDDWGRDHKSALQELCQRRYHEFPRYELLGTSGPDHRKSFHVAVSVAGNRLAEGLGPSKKRAEQEAARAALERLGTRLRAGD